MTAIHNTLFSVLRAGCQRKWRVVLLEAIFICVNKTTADSFEVNFEQLSVLWFVVHLVLLAL